MYYAIKSYASAIDSGSLCHNGDPDFIRHIGNTGRRLTRGVDEDGQPRFILTKISQERKYDITVSAILSWQARMDALQEGAQPPQKWAIPVRVR